MSVNRTQVAVIGGGLAAFTAASTLARRGANVVMVHPPSPGASALWSGLGQVYGPPTEFLPYSTGQIGASSTPRSAVALRRAERFTRLQKRRPFHPYVRLELSRDDVGDALHAAVSALDYPGLEFIEAELVLPSPSAAPFPADLAARSVAVSAIQRGDRVGVVGCRALTDWYPSRLIEALGGVDTVEARPIEAAPFSELSGTSQHSVKVATRLARRLEEDPDMLADALGDAVDEHDLDLLILPPCVGRTWSEHARLFDELGARLSCRVAESAAARNSIHGWRLDRFLRSRSDLEVVSSRALSSDGSDTRLHKLDTEAGGLEADAFIIATGRWIGGGLPTATPLREPIFDIDLWLDGAPIADAEEAWPPHLLERHVWDDHPLFRAGLATDAALRPLNHRGEPVADNLFAAGRVLAGFHPFADGTTEGVDLVTGHFAARSALEALGLAGAASTSDSDSDSEKAAP